MLGLNGGAGGSGFSAPAQANILNPTTVDQANTAYTNAQTALTGQQNFTNAVNAQNGVGNQANVYGQLQGIVNGTGPNPAQAQLAQATGANTANQAALMAGQRGSNANAGLLARQAAMQGAANQQNAIGQGASLQAQQSLNALQGAGNIAGQQVGQAQAANQAANQAAQGEQQNILGGIANQNTANVNMQNGINTANAGLANTSMQGGQALVGGLMNSAGGISKAVGSLFASGGNVRPMYAAGGLPQAGQYAPINPNAPDVFNPTQTNAGAPISIPGVSAPNSAPPTGTAPPKAASSPAVSNTGAPANNKSAAPQSAPVAQQSNQQQTPAAQPFDNNYGNPGANALYKGASSFGQFLAGAISSLGKPSQPTPVNNDQAGGPNDSSSSSPMSPGSEMSPDSSTMNAAEGGKVPAMVSPGERYLPPSEVKEVKAGKKNPMEAGEKIPGEPEVKGAKDSYANDTVPKDLEAGGLVLPRSVTQAKHPHWAAMKFVQAHMAQGGKVLPSKPKAKK